jgi:signal transduction histidine kinase
VTFKVESVIFQVSDNGIGINPFIFNQPEENFGLGLKSIYERAKLIDAKFEIESSSSEGTRIHLTLPKT